MAEASVIEWTDATVNFWWGCTKVGPGCDHCYAETLNAFRGNGEWGAGTPRRKIKGATKLLASLNNRPFMDELGRRRRVFMSSMSDVFDNEVDPEWRMEAYHGAAHARNLDIQLLTKRVANVAKMAPPSWTSGEWPSHVGLMITVVNQPEADRDIPRLIMLKKRFNIPWIGISAEPLLGPIDLRTWLPWLDWVICGGESGRHARPMHPGWARMLRDQCAASGTPFLFKQWGEWLPRGPVGWGYPLYDGLKQVKLTDRGEDASRLESEGGHPVWMQRAGKKRAGRLLDGRTHDEFPRSMS